MAQTGISGSNNESLLNIFPNPCIGDTYLYTDDPQAAWVYIYDAHYHEKAKWKIEVGKTLHIELILPEGTYQLVLKDDFQHQLGAGKSIYISGSY